MTRGSPRSVHAWALESDLVLVFGSWIYVDLRVEQLMPLTVQMVSATDDMRISTPCQPCDALSSGNWGSYSAMQGGKAA